MNYNDALEYIHSTKKFGSKLGLENIRELLRLLGNPQKNLKIIHIAGTNGKGSTSSFITSMLKEAKYRVGLFTSPYLEKFTERIRINDDNISEDDLARITYNVKDKVSEMISSGYNHPTEFEIVTAIAFQYYMEANVDYVVLEVGLGGRFDSTNVIEKSLASVITPIDIDHVQYLGDTIDKIAYEKAGIIKDNGMVITHPQDIDAQQVLDKVAKGKNAQLIVAPLEDIIVKDVSEYGSKFDFTFGDVVLENLEIVLIGHHQIFNAATALTTILTLRDNELLDINDELIREGLKKTKWIGRLEILKRNPVFLIDGAHNMAGIKSLKKAILELFYYDRLILGVGMLADKDVESMIAEIACIADKVIITEPNIFRAMKPEELAKKVEKYNKNYIIEKDINKAIEKSFEIANEKDLIVFGGSLYLIGDVRKIITMK